METISADKKNTKELDLIMIGKTGNGKSATGNSILLKEEVFKSSSSSKSVTKAPQYEWSKFEDCEIQVVDAPGVVDTDSKEHEDIKLIQGAMMNAMLSNPEGYHAFLIVVKYGARFTNEEQKAILLLKGILGLDFLKNFGIVVMCNGDQLKRDQKKKGITIESYCKEEKGPFKQLLEECNGRIVVFDNETENYTEKHEQVKNLVAMVDQLQNDGKRYTNEHFEKAGVYRKNMYITSKIPMIEKETLKSQRLILDEIQNIEHETDENVKMERLDKLLQEIDKLKQSIKIKDKGTGALNTLLKIVEGTYQNVIERIEVIKKCIKIKDEMKAREEKLIRETEEKIKQEKEKLEKEKLVEQEKMEKEMARLQQLAAEEAETQRKKLEQIEEQRRRQKEDYERKENEMKQKVDDERAKTAETLRQEKEKLEKERLDHQNLMENMKTEEERLKKLAADEAEKQRKNLEKMMEEQKRIQKEDYERRENEIKRKADEERAALEREKQKKEEEMERENERLRREQDKRIEEFNKVKEDTDKGFFLKVVDGVVRLVKRVFIRNE